MTYYDSLLILKQHEFSLALRNLYFTLIFGLKNLYQLSTIYNKKIENYHFDKLIYYLQFFFIIRNDGLDIKLALHNV